MNSVSTEEYIATLKAENSSLKAQVKHWKSNHDNILKQYNKHRNRPDVLTYKLEEQLKKAVELAKYCEDIAYGKNNDVVEKCREFLEYCKSIEGDKE